MSLVYPAQTSAGAQALMLVKPNQSDIPVLKTLKSLRHCTGWPYPTSDTSCA